MYSPTKDLMFCFLKVSEDKIIKLYNPSYVARGIYKEQSDTQSRPCRLLQCVAIAGTTVLTSPVYAK